MYEFECGSCSAGVPEEAKFCTNCGESFEDPELWSGEGSKYEASSETVDADPVASSSVGIGKAGRLGSPELDPEVKRLREELAAKERLVEGQLAKRLWAEEAEKRKAETEQQVAELVARIAEVDEQVSALSLYVKVCTVGCPFCAEMSPFPFEVCPHCSNRQTNQHERVKIFRCGKCDGVCDRDDESCSLCDATF